MNSREKSSKSASEGRPMLWLARALLVGALAGALYLAWLSAKGGVGIGCGPDGGCEEVLRSRWGKWMGIPVGVLAALTYGLLLAVSGASMPKISKRDSVDKPETSTLLLMVGAVLVFGAAIWFVFLQAVIVRKFCPYCCATHAMAALGALLLLQPVISRIRPWWTQAIGFAAVGLGALIAGQTLSAPDVAQRGTLAGVGQNSSVSNPQPKAPPERWLSFYTNQIRFDVFSTPHYGPPGASNVMISMFDYSCHHCRSAHTSLAKACRTFTNSLAMLALPMPLDAQCNAWIKRTPKSHTNACELAKLGLAVWRADSKQFETFDDWMMEPAETRPLPVARLKATELVGEEKLTAALIDPWVNETLQKSISLHRANWVALNSGNMPMIMIGTNIIAGALRDDREIFELLEAGFGLRRP